MTRRHEEGSEVTTGKRVRFKGQAAAQWGNREVAQVLQVVKTGAHRWARMKWEESGLEEMCRAIHLEVLP